ncbi:Inner membrane protein YedI [compost metagenome]
MKTLSIVGTAAMFMVGGSILVHGLAPVHHLIQHGAELATSLPAGAILAALTPTLLGALFGIVAGGVVVAAVMLFKRLRTVVAL